jgi:aspartate aminotransferase
MIRNPVMSFIADRLNRILPSQTIAVTQKARALKAEGRDIISLSAGEPDFDTPDFIKRAAIRAIEAGKTKYTDVPGTIELRKAVAARLNADFDLDYKAEEICVSTGGKQVIYNVMVSTLNAGDEVIIPAPAWVSYPDIVTLADGTPVIIQTAPENGFRLTAEQLRAAITPRTKWLCLNSPCNPTGAAYDEAALKELTDVLLDYPDIWILTDDMYAKLLYDGAVAKTVVQVEPRLRSRTVTMNGVSKAYAMTGWRIGFAAAPVEFTKQLIKLQGQSTSNPCSIAQAAAQEAVSGPQDFISEMVAVYQERRNLVIGMLNDAPGLSCALPEGAFYAFPSIAGVLGKTSKGGRLIESDEAFVTALLEETGVAAVHGTAFLTPGYFRISYATSTDLLVEACTRIQKFCQGLS